jgi:signal transduction histidine kinase
MQIKEIIASHRRQFNTTVALVGVIPFLVFIYILVVKISSFNIMTGEVGQIMLATMFVFLSGLAIGRKMFWNIVKELVEKNRLAAITETALALGHEINNPLLSISGNLELMEMDIGSSSSIPIDFKNRLNTIKNNCQRIQDVTTRLSTLIKPVSSTVYGSYNMVDLRKSK